MGMLALGRHLGSCERKLDGVEQQKEYAIADSEVKVKKANEQMAKAKNLLGNVKKSTSSDRSQARAAKKQLMKKITTLEKEVTKLNTQYDAEFTAWWRLKDTMTKNLAKYSSCICKKAKKASFLQTWRGPPPKKDMYDTARKVEECEGKIIKIAAEIKTAEKTGRDATITAIEDRSSFGRRMADQQHLNKLLNLKPQITPLKTTKLTLEKLVKARRQKVDKYKLTNAKIQKSLKELDSHMDKCGC